MGYWSRARSFVHNQENTLHCTSGAVNFYAPPIITIDAKEVIGRDTRNVLYLKSIASSCAVARFIACISAAFRTWTSGIFACNLI